MMPMPQESQESQESQQHNHEATESPAVDTSMPAESTASAKDELDGSPLLHDVLGDALPKMEMFHGKLQEEGELRGLIGPRELPRLWERHILNSAALAPFIEKLLRDSKANTFSVADIGSGAGFPGIVLAAMFPSVSFSLIETMERRVEWLDEVVKDLALDNVTVIRARAEEVIGTRYFDAVTCRAVAPMTKLSHWMLPLLKSGGVFVALKGRSAQAEIDKAAKEIRKERGVSPQVHEAPVGEGLESTYVVTIRKR